MKRGFLATGLMLLPILGLVAYYFVTTPTNGDFWWYDSSRHAMNGVFLRDLLVDGLRHPIQFSSAYYEKYPAINIGFYPPFFYLSSVPLLLLLGTTHAVSQAVVALYTLGLGFCIMMLCRRMMDGASAVAVAVCVLALAPVALWSRQVQPDVPAVTLFVFAAYALIRHLDEGKQSWLFIAATAMGLGVLTRVQGSFMALVWVYFIFIRMYPSRPPLVRRMVASLLAAVIALPAIAMAVYFAKTNQALTLAMPGMPSLWSWDNWIWYIAQLPEQVGYPALLVMAAGIGSAIWLGFQKRATLELKVIAAFGICAWVFFTVVSNKEPRFNLPGVVFMFILSACALRLVFATAGRLIIPALALGLLFQIHKQASVPVVQGFENAVAAVATVAPLSSNVLISAHRDGSFIYDLRTQSVRHDIGVRRADKLLVEVNIMRQLGIRDRGLSQSDILRMLDTQKIDTIVFQPGYLDDQPAIQNLAELLEHSGRFVKVATIPLRGETNRNEQQLIIYSKQSQLRHSKDGLPDGLVKENAAKQI